MKIVSVLLAHLLMTDKILKMDIYVLGLQFMKIQN
jgi:hypothetical protein